MATTRALPVKVLQFGQGRFLRAFADWIFDVLNEQTGFSGAIRIVLPFSKEVPAVWSIQHSQYHVILRGTQGGREVNESRLITSVVDVMSTQKDYPAFLRNAENPDLLFIVSNTTEAGITFSADDGSPDVIPLTFPGKLTALLFRRFVHFQGAAEKGVILLPCELIPDNGTKLREAVLEYASHWTLPVAFAAWINASNSFCNTLVDRIVTSAGKGNGDPRYDEDALAAYAEPYHEWLIEDMPQAKKHLPRYPGLNIRFVPQLAPYYERKVRILNGAHTAMMAIAFLGGHRTVADAANDPFITSFLNRLIHDEIIPTLGLPASELVPFAGQVMERFRNPWLQHDLLSIALNSISKFKFRLLPTLLSNLEHKKAGGTLLMFSFACLLRFYKGVWRGVPIPLKDDPGVIEFFSTLWRTQDAAGVIEAVLPNKDLWGTDLSIYPALRDRLLGSVYWIDNWEANPGLNMNEILIM